VYDHNWCSTTAPLHEGMRFAVAHHTQVVMRLSTLWEAVSLAAQSILGRLPIDVSKAGVVGEMVARFEERAEWCLCLETSGLRVCDFILGPTDGRVHLVTHLEDVVGQVQAMQDQHQALRNSVARIRAVVLERFSVTPSLAVALSPTTDLIEGHIDAVAANGAHWRA
jgi:hypothetical protein